MMRSLKKALPQSLFGKIVWFLVISIFFSIIYSKSAKADGESKSAGESRYFLVQGYVGEKSIEDSIPHKVFCLPKKCSVFVGANEIKSRIKATTKIYQNPWLKKGCTEESLGSTRLGSEITCKASNLKLRTLEIDEREHSLHLARYLLNRVPDKNNMSWI